MDKWKGTMMKNRIFFLMLASVTSMFARDVTGKVWVKENGSQKGIPGMLVSDGYNFATTDEQGEFTLSLDDRASAVFVQRTDDYTADVAQFWQFVADKSRFEFEMTPARKPSLPLTIIHAGDVESDNLDYLEGVRDIMASHPEASLFIMAGDIANRDVKCLEVHRDKVNAATLGIPVVYCCGNHDVDFRGKWAGGSKCPYLHTLGPWWSSFIHGEMLFVIAPIYNSWGAPLLYSMLDFGDYLKKLCARYPNYGKVLVCHDIPDLVGYKVKSNSGDIDLDAENFVAIIYGHKHMNIAKNYASGRKAYSVATPNKGGSGGFGHSLRLIQLSPNSSTSKIIYWNLKNHLAIASPAGHSVAISADGKMQISVAAYNGGDDIVSVMATIGDETISLQASGWMAWTGQANAVESGICKVVARAKSGKVIEQQVEFKADTSTLKWTAALPGEIALAEPLLANGRLYIALSDDANSENGGVCALDPADGKLLWHAKTRYGIRNNIATDGKLIFAIDTRANIHALDAATGKQVWKNDSDPNIVSPSASGIVCENDIVVGGYGRHLRGINASTGEVIWRNTAWQTEERTPAEDKLCLVGDSTVLVISRLNGLFRHEIKTGKVRWQYKTLFLNGTATVDGQNVFVVGQNNELIKLSLADGTKISSTRQSNCYNYAGAPVPAPGGLLLVGSGNSGLVAFDKDDLIEKWRFKPGNALVTTADYVMGKPQAVTATAALDGSTAWIPANDGWLYNIALTDGAVLEKINLGAPLLTKCIVANDTIYIGDMTGRVFALGK
jgi:outer membrane protein assembly factor BamB